MTRPRLALALAAALAGCGPSNTFFQAGNDLGGAGRDLVFVFPGGDLAAQASDDAAAGDDAGAPDLGSGADAGPVCNPQDPPTCDGNGAVRQCRMDGSGYDTSPCPALTTCMNGQCRCAMGVVSCQGQQIVQCGMDGMFHATGMCPNGTACHNGLCDDLRCPDEYSSVNPFALPPDAWARFRHDNRNTGWTPAVVADMPKLKWKVSVGGTNLNVGGGLAAGPVVNQLNQIFIGAGEGDGKGGSYYSFDPMGKPLWSFAAQRGYGISTPAVRADGTSYFSTTNSTLFAVDPVGMKAWSFPVGAQADSDPIITKDGILIYGDDDGTLYALDNTGKVAWKSDANSGPGEVDSGLAESCDGRIYAGGKNGWLQIDAKTGMTNWKVAAGGQYAALLSSPLVAADGTMYGFDSAGTGVAIDPMGKVLWQKPLGPAGAGSSPARIAGTLFVVLNDAQLHAIDAGTGVEKWKQPVNDNPHTYLNAGPIIDGKQRIYFNSSDGFVYAFDITGKQQWKLPASGVAHAMAWSGSMAIGRDGTLYVPGNDGILYAFQ